jgi:hypothetical protein
MRPASWTARPPTSRRSSATTCWRSLAICAVAASVMRAGLGPRLDAGLLDDLRALGLRLGADAAGLVAGLGELLLVLREQRLRLLALRFGLGEAALDGGRALGEDALEDREDLRAQEQEQQGERDQADDQLGQVRDEGVRLLAGFSGEHRDGAEGDRHS